MNTHSRIQALEEQEAQANDTSSSSVAHTTITIAHGIEEMMQAFAVRAAVFLSELNCPYAEEFDGNDFTATHFLGYVNGEPASACRVRYFADFARIERVAVRRQFRGRPVCRKMIRFVHDFCRKKGFTRIHGHTEERLVRFWERFGYRRLAAPSFSYGGHGYVEMVTEFEAHPDPIAIGKDPLLLVRPEGSWAEPVTCEVSDNLSSTQPVEERQGGDSWTTELKEHMKRLG